MNSTANRKQVWVDKELQGIVLRRIMIYWLMCFCFLTIPLLIARTVTDPSKFFFEHFPTVVAEFWPMYVGLVVLFPVVAYDSLLLSHRISGPLLRIRTQLESLASGDTSNEVRLREKDFMQELVQPINEIRDVFYNDGSRAKADAMDHAESSFRS